MPKTIDYSRMSVGRVLNRWPGGVQAIELCPACGRPGKPRCCPGGRQYVHTARVVGRTYTQTVVVCIVPQQE